MIPAISPHARLQRAVLRQPAEYAGIGQAAAALVRDRYAHDVTLPKLAEHLQRLVERGGRTRHARFVRPPRLSSAIRPARFTNKIGVHFDGIDTEMYQPRQGPRIVALHKLPAGKQVVTFVARGLEAARGFDVFLRLAQRIGREWSDVLFVVVGDEQTHYGWDALFTGGESFKQWAMKQGDYDLSRFLFTGHIESAELTALLRRSDLHVYLSMPFALSWSLFNALACGCVVLAGDVPPVRKIIRPDENGLLELLFDEERLAAGRCVYSMTCRCSAR